MTIPGLRLTFPTAELAEQFLTWRHRPDVTRWFLQQRIEDTEEYVADWAAYDDHDHHRVVAVLDGVMVGQATLGVVDGMGSRVTRRSSLAVRGGSRTSCTRTTRAGASRRRSRARRS
jgi:hypothetical protein